MYYCREPLPLFTSVKQVMAEKERREDEMESNIRNTFTLDEIKKLRPLTPRMEHLKGKLIEERS